MITLGDKRIYTEMSEVVDPAHSALLIIDVQNDYCSRGGSFDKAGKLTPGLVGLGERIEPVLAKARALGIMIVHIQMIRLPGLRSDSPGWLRKQVVSKNFDPSKLDMRVVLGTWGAEIADRVQPRPGELLVQKHRSSAFCGTDLDLLLRSNSIETVVLCGCVTEGCVESTARDAQFHDYYTAMLEDCVASSDQQLHDASLLVMRRRCDVVNSAEVLGLWNAAAVGTPR